MKNDEISRNEASNRFFTSFIQRIEETLSHTINITFTHPAARRKVAILLPCFFAPRMRLIRDSSISSSFPFLSPLLYILYVYIINVPQLNRATARRPRFSFSIAHYRTRQTLVCSSSPSRFSTNSLSTFSTYSSSLLNSTICNYLL